MIQIVEISTAQTYALRRAVLRNADPERSVAYAEDELPGTFHLGVRDESGAIVATSTWTPMQLEEFADRTAIRLRGMATAAAVQGRGIGGLLIEAGAERAAQAGFGLLWAHARDTALAFYVRHACAVVGDGFISEGTGLPHHVVVRDLTSTRPVDSTR